LLKGFGEGLYIGSAVSNWIKNIADLSIYNKALYNNFGPYIGAECNLDSMEK